MYKCERCVDIKLNTIVADRRANTQKISGMHILGYYKILTLKANIYRKIGIDEQMYIE